MNPFMSKQEQLFDRMVEALKLALRQLEENWARIEAEWGSVDRTLEQAIADEEYDTEAIRAVRAVLKELA